jgi:hypothetical protein
MTLTGGALSEEVPGGATRVRDVRAGFAMRLFEDSVLFAVIGDPGILAIAPHPNRIIP